MGFRTTISYLSDVELELAKSESNILFEPTPHGAFMQDTGISILVVEDEQPIRSLLTEILSPRFQCANAESAGEAIRLMESKFFHLALVDVGLPGMSGVSLCRLIVNRSPRTVIIVISGKTDTQSISEAMKAGAADYVTKPFNLSGILMTVERALERYLPGAVA